jgi:hypothetical protein
MRNYSAPLFVVDRIVEVLEGNRLDNILPTRESNDTLVQVAILSIDIENMVFGEYNPIMLEVRERYPRYGRYAREGTVEFVFPEDNRFDLNESVYNQLWWVRESHVKWKEVVDEQHHLFY